MQTPVDRPIDPKAIFQIGYVVPDLDAARAYFEQQLGIGPWLTIDRPEIDDRTHRGDATPRAYEAISLAFVGDLQIELMQPVAGPSIFADFLAANPRGGPHRIALEVDEFDGAVEALGGGEAIVQSGRVDEYRFAFFDAPALGGLMEVLRLDEGARRMLDQLRDRAG